MALSCIRRERYRTLCHRWLPMAGGDVIDCTLRGAGLWSILLTLGDLINSVQRRLLAHSLSSQRKPAQRGLSSGLSHGLDAALGGCTAPWMLVRIWSLENGETASRDEKTRPGGEAPRRVQSLRVGFQARATHVTRAREAILSPASAVAIWLPRGGRKLARRN
jgi:hypothetical protein